jgi:hypothetical protein
MTGNRTKDYSKPGFRKKKFPIKDNINIGTPYLLWIFRYYIISLRVYFNES